jgi:hypothetical protein
MLIFDDFGTDGVIETLDTRTHENGHVDIINTTAAESPANETPASAEKRAHEKGATFHRMLMAQLFFLPGYEMQHVAEAAKRWTQSDWGFILTNCIEIYELFYRKNNTTGKPPSIPVATPGDDYGAGGRLGRCLRTRAVKGLFGWHDGQFGKSEGGDGGQKAR